MICKECGREIDIENVFYDNRCFVCGASQGYDKEDFGK